MRDIVLLGAARTPIGAFQGALADLPAPRLGAIALKAALARAEVIPPELVGEVIMGNVLAAGLGQAPARQAAHHAGLPRSVGATSVNKMCGSGLKAVVLGAQAIANGDAEVILAGGMESMSQAPYLLPKARDGLRMGHGQVIDSMIHDGLWDVYGNVHMGDCSELCAREKNISRQDQDAFAAESYRRAKRAQAEGRFAGEIAPVEIAQRKGPPKLVAHDEEPERGDPDKLASLRPAFQKDGTITAGNASSLSDGAAAVVLASGDTASQAGRPGARPAGRIGRARAGPRVVHHRPGVGHRAPAGQGRLAQRRRRSVRDQRGLRGGRAGQQPAAGPGPGAGQHLGRRGGAGPPDRGQRRAHPGHLAGGAGSHRGQTRGGLAVHRRRRGNRGRDRAA